MSNTIVVNKRNEPYDIDISRPSIWGNPFEISPGCTREDALIRYEIHVRRRPDLLARLPELVGKRLGCVCDPLPCHGHVLVKLIHEKGLGM